MDHQINIGTNTIKLLEVNIGKNFDLELSNSFLNVTSKGQAT
jgi:hypothetical protein